MLEAKAVRELVEGGGPEATLCSSVPASGTWLVARTGSPQLAKRAAEHLNRALADPEPEERGGTGSEIA